MTKTYLTIIIPCYNEEKNITRGVLGEVKQYLEKQKYSWEVIISDDRSTDKSVKLVKEFVAQNLQFFLLENPHAGKPFALKAGLAKAKGEIVLFTDMDQSTPISEIDKLLLYFKQGYQVVIGSRGMIRKNAPVIRKIMAWLFLNFRRLFLLPQIVDTQCGFKAFGCLEINKIFSKMEMFKNREKTLGWRVTAYDVEVLFLAQKLGLKIKEVLVDWQDQDVSVGKQKNFIKESKEMLKEILRVKINDLRGNYE